MKLEVLLFQVIYYNYSLRIDLPSLEICQIGEYAFRETTSLTLSSINSFSIIIIIIDLPKLANFTTESDSLYEVTNLVLSSNKYYYYIH